MYKLTIHPSRYLKEENTLFNTLMLIATTLLLYSLSNALQVEGHVALFWPLNAVLVGLFSRYSFFNRPYYYTVSLLSLLVWDSFFTINSPGAVLVNVSNMSFVLILVNCILREGPATAETVKLNVLRLYSYCLLSALLCSVPGSYGFALSGSASFRDVYPVWFSEEFSTSVLILPFLLTWTGLLRFRSFELKKLLPFITLILSLTVSGLSGGIGSLSMTLPALIWCAISYSLPTTCLLTMLTGTAEVLMVDAHWVYTNLTGHITQVFSARMGIASIAISPVIVAASVQAINTLVKQLSARANYDYLTRVHSRYGLYEQLKAQDQKAVNTPLNVMLLDIDHFKNINDTHGHDCGDNVLSAFASRVQEVVGEQGIVARMGGEEFAVVMPDASEGKGYRLAEAIREEIEQMELTWGSDTLTLTVSIGLSHGEAARRGIVDSFDRLLTEADHYLYQSKKTGRNRTSAAPSVMDKHLAHSAS